MTTALPVLETDFQSGGIRIVALNGQQLELFLADQSALFNELNLPKQAFEDWPEVIEICQNHCLPAMKKAGNGWPFFARWLAIDVGTGLIVADFILKTGLDSTGAIEIGYGIQPAFEGRGLMTRTISCFIEWAKKCPEVLRVKAETERNNIASSRVLEKNGFRQFAPLIDSVWWEKRV